MVLPKGENTLGGELSHLELWYDVVTEWKGYLDVEVDTRFLIYIFWRVLFGGGGAVGSFFL